MTAKIGMTVDDMYGYLVENGYFTEEELCLLTSINGWNYETLDDAIYARYGYRDLEQLMEAE